MYSHRSKPLRRLAIGDLSCAAGRAGRFAITVGALTVAAAPVAQAATVETVARGLDNPRSVAVAADGSVFVGTGGRGRRKCQGKGEQRQCLGLTSRIVRYANGKARTYAKGFASLAGPDGSFAGGANACRSIRRARCSRSRDRPRQAWSSGCPRS